MDSATLHLGLDVLAMIAILALLKEAPRRRRLFEILREIYHIAIANENESVRPISAPDSVSIRAVGYDVWVWLTPRLHGKFEIFDGLADLRLHGPRDTSVLKFTRRGTVRTWIGTEKGQLVFARLQLAPRRMYGEICGPIDGKSLWLLECHGEENLDFFSGLGKSLGNAFNVIVHVRLEKKRVDVVEAWSF